MVVELHGDVTNGVGVVRAVEQGDDVATVFERQHLGAGGVAVDLREGRPRGDHGGDVEGGPARRQGRCRHPALAVADQEDGVTGADARAMHRLLDAGGVGGGLAGDQPGGRSAGRRPSASCDHGVVARSSVPGR